MCLKSASITKNGIRTLNLTKDMVGSMAEESYRLHYWLGSRYNQVIVSFIYS